MDSSLTLPAFEELYLGGGWRPPRGAATIDLVSPTTERVIARVPEASVADVDAAVAAGREAFAAGEWSSLAMPERAAALARVADEIELRAAAMAEVFTAEVGAPIAVSRGMHALAAEMWRIAAAAAERVWTEETREGGDVLVLREPVGTVGIVIPWNGPVPTGSLKLSAALAAGCSAVLKPASEACLTTFMLAEAIDAAGLPDGVVSILPGGGEVGEHLVGHPGIDKVSFTGSTATGRRIMRHCGERIARVSLELGGKSAAIVTDDADFAAVVPALVQAGVGHSGQVCAALTRVLVSERRADEMAAALGAALGELTVGDPADPETDLGPLALRRQLDRVRDYIDLGVREGARLVVGGGRPAGLERGWFVEPTLFADTSSEMRIVQEEIFGPVLCLQTFKDEQDAVRLANESRYGLSGAVFAGDRERAARIARQLQTGQVFVNEAGICVTQPYGGWKESGIGREGGAEGIEMYLETKVLKGV